MSCKIAHLEMIQGVVNRLSNNSFLMKGWSVTLISAIFIFMARSGHGAFAYFAFLPAIMFWGLDGYFLRQERLFRKLYDQVRETEEEKVNFSMNTQVVEDQVKSWWGVTISITLLPFHGVMLLLTFLIFMVSIFLLP